MPSFSSQLRDTFRPNAAWWGFVAALGLTAIGINAIGSSSEPSLMGKQTQWLAISIVAMGVVCLPNPRVLSILTWPLLGIILAMMVVLIVPGVPSWLVHARKGARCWINLHFMDFQPSEIAKILFVMALARYMRYRENYRTLGGLMAPFAIMFIPVLLILAQPDLGTAMLFPPALFAILIAGGAKLKHIMPLIGIIVVAVGVNVAVIAYDPPPDPNALDQGRRLPDWMHVLRGYQEKRIASMMWPDRYKLHEGYQQDTALNLIGAGGVTGYCKDQAARIIYFNNLPEDHNDMVFTIIVNRWGMAGGMVVLLLYLLMTLAFLLVAARSKDPFARLTIVGFLGLIVFQASLNIAVNLGLAPVIGITLPFVSYGGSSLVASFMMVGIIINFASRRAALLARPSFEFDNPEAIFQ